MITHRFAAIPLAAAAGNATDYVVEAGWPTWPSSRPAISIRRS
jgi:hypothetical protein